MNRQGRFRTAMTAATAVIALTAGALAAPVSATASPAADTGALATDTAALAELIARTGATKIPVSSFAKVADGAAPSRATVQAGPPVIYCYITVSNPTKLSSGGQFPFDLMFANTFLFCTYPVGAIDVAAQLDWNGIEESFNAARSVGVSAAAVSTLTDCVDGFWQSFGAGIVYAPPGYSPPSVTVAVPGANLRFDCL